MKKSLKHLRASKRNELAAIVDIIRDMADVEMIILFGSYARGDFVHRDFRVEFGTATEYRSDYDILVIAPHRKMLNGLTLENRLSERIDRLLADRTPVTLIAHTISEVNHRLAEGQYFFSDIKQEGILLYDAKRHKLARRGKLKPERFLQLIKSDYNEWYRSANLFFLNFQSNLRRRHHKIAAFELHQAAERYYITISLVFTRYKPKTHDLEKLGKRAVMCHPEFRAAFPRTTADEEKCFDLLKRAYIEARYNPQYRITKKQLLYLEKRVKKLRLLTRKICQEKMVSFTEQMDNS